MATLYTVYSHCTLTEIDAFLVAKLEAAHEYIPEFCLAAEETVKTEPKTVRQQWKKYADI